LQPLCHTLSDALVRAKHGPLNSMQNDFLLHARLPVDERREVTARRGTRTQWSLRHGRARYPGFPPVGVGAAVVLDQAASRQPSGVSSKVSLGASSRSASARRSTISSTDGLPETFSR